MPSPGSDNSQDDPRLNEIIARYLQGVESGQVIDRDQFVSEHSEFADELRDFFADKSRIGKLAGSGEWEPPASAGPVDAVTLPPQSVTRLDAPMLDSIAGRDPGPRPGSILRYFGDYELLEEIARGGMGVVYKARQVKLNRVVAIKMILSGQLASKEDVRRFYTEAEAAAGLDHPGVVPIYEVGQQEGQHFFSMGFVDGPSLSSRLSDGPLPPREAAELLADVCDAIQYAHDRGVIHRDLKPANILLASGGRQPVDSARGDLPGTSGDSRPTLAGVQPKVTDFGLAKKTAADSNLTGTGQILGTPSYMPPEQAAGRLHEIRETADVYSLGAILYATLTGRAPFLADNPLDTLLQVLEREPVPPRALNPKAPLDLETICLKCLRKESRRRYGSARELADDLNRFLRGEAILARPVPAWERSAKWAARNPASVLSLGLVYMFLSTVLCVFGAANGHSEMLVPVVVLSFSFACFGALVGLIIGVLRRQPGQAIALGMLLGFVLGQAATGAFNMLPRATKRQLMPMKVQPAAIQLARSD